MNIDNFTYQYLIAALEAELLFVNYSIEDFSDPAFKKAKDDCNRFRKLTGDARAFINEDKIAKDFWKSRNNSSSRELGLLSDCASKEFCSCGIRIGEDGYLYL